MCAEILSAFVSFFSLQNTGADIERQAWTSTLPEISESIFISRYAILGDNNRKKGEKSSAITVICIYKFWREYTRIIQRWADSYEVIGYNWAIRRQLKTNGTKSAFVSVLRSLLRSRETKTKKKESMIESGQLRLKRGNFVSTRKKSCYNDRYNILYGYKRNLCEIKLMSY